MKIGTTELVKFRQLKRAFGLPHFTAVGLLESIWMFAAKNSPQGDIGKHSNEDIACMIEWDRDPDELIDNLVKYQWFDTHPEHRLTIHDWSDHAPNWLKGNLASHGKQFADTLSQPAKRSAKQPAHSASQAATKSSQSNSIKSSPQHSAESATTSTSCTDDLQVMVDLLGNVGIAAALQTARVARKSGYTTALIVELIAELEKRPQLGPGALAWRIQNVAPNRPLDEGWPDSKPITKPAPEIEVGRYAADWSLLRPSRRAELARQAQIDLSGHEGQGLKELPPALQKPIIEILARGAERKPSPKPEA